MYALLGTALEQPTHLSSVCPPKKPNDDDDENDDDDDDDDDQMVMMMMEHNYKPLKLCTDHQNT